MWFSFNSNTLRQPDTYSECLVKMKDFFLLKAPPLIELIFLNFETELRLRP